MENVTWLGHASFSFIDLSSGKRIYYIDPFQLPTKDLEKADIIFVTHAHHDHLSPQDISSILKDDTVVVATPDSLETLEIPNEQKFPVEPNKSYDVKGFHFETVPAYNIKPQRLEFHPHKNNWVGYIFDVNNVRFYHAGDTDFIPEMQELAHRKIDVAMLPMGGNYTMDVDEMILAVNAIKPKKVISMHYKMLLGDKAKEAEEKLKAGVKNSEVLILEEFK